MLNNNHQKIMPRFQKRNTRRPFRRRRVYRKRALVRKRNTGAIGRTPRVYPFTREIWSDIDLGTGNVSTMGFPDYWLVATPFTDRLNFQPRIHLSELTNYTEFQALFGQYRINAMSVTFYPAHATNYADGNTTVSTGYLKEVNLLMFVKQNQTGVTETSLSNEDWSQISRKRTSIFCAGRKPTTLYSATKSLIPTVQEDGTVSNASTYVSPMRWQSTNDTATQNACFTISLATMDGTDFADYTANQLRFKMRTKVYLDTRFVK